MGVDAIYGSIHCNSATMSLTEGITPDVGTLILPVSAAGRIPRKANLVLRDGLGGSVQIADVYALAGSLRKLPGGNEVSVQVADRRCLWQWGQVSQYLAAYNQPDADGSANHERSLAMLIYDCFDALPGIAGSHVDDPLASGVFPPVSWDAANAAQAAQDLCDQFGLAISLSPAGRVTAAPAYSRDVPWPAGQCERLETESAPLLKPAVIRIVGARIVNEHTFEDLEPVGLEKDGTIRAIGDLSYTPAHGWGDEPPITFPNLAGGTYNGTAYTADEARELARKCLWTWYAITNSTDRELLPLLDVRAEVVAHQGNDERGRPYIDSENARWDGTKWQADAKGRISSGFSLDRELGIVMFEEPVYAATTTGASHGGLAAPDMDLRAAYEMVAFYSYDYTVAGGVPGTVMQHRVPELRQWEIGLVAQNTAALDAYAWQVARRLAERFSAAGPEARAYPRIVAATPKGLLRSVQWTADADQGAGTVVQKVLDFPSLDGMPAYEEKLRRRRQQVLLDRFDAFERTDRSGYSMGLKPPMGGRF